MGDERGETPAMGEGGEEKATYNAGASAPPAPPWRRAWHAWWTATRPEEQAAVRAKFGPFRSRK